jgi:hypothetical protein
LGDKVAAAAAASSIEPNSSRETGEKQLGDTVSAAKSTLEQIQRRKQPGRGRVCETTRQQQPRAAEGKFRQGRQKGNRRKAAQKEIYKGKGRPKGDTRETNFVSQEKLKTKVANGDKREAEGRQKRWPKLNSAITPNYS